MYNRGLYYIKENIDKILNPEEVNCILTLSNDRRQRFLGAYLTNGEFLQLTKPKSFFTYPFEPIINLQNILGYEYMKDFASLYDNEHAVNVKNVADIQFQKADDKYVDVVALFKEGNPTKLYSVKEKYAAKEEVMLDILLQNEAAADM